MSGTMTRPAPLLVYAQATAQDLLEAIPAYEALDCDLAAISVAWMRHSATSMSTGMFKVRGMPFPATNFSSVHLILSPLVRAEDGRRTLAPVAAYLRAHDITDLRIVGSGHWDRRHQYSRDRGHTWGGMPVRGQAPAQPAPTVLIEPDIPAAPETEEELYV